MLKTNQLTTRDYVRNLTVTALFMAMNILLSMSIFSIPVPGGHLYFNDVIINTAAILLNPWAAFAVGGIGSFLGDMLFYPAPMFVSLVTHGLQAVVVSLISHRFRRVRPEYAVLKLPFQIFQAGFGAVISIILLYPMQLQRTYNKLSHIS